jgi:Recombination endonuclease VII
VSANITNPKWNSRGTDTAAEKSAGRAKAIKPAKKLSGSPVSNTARSSQLTRDRAGAAASSPHFASITNIRGLLCSNCNRGIGLLGDSLEGVLSAVEYLQRYEVRKITTTNSRAEKGGQKER